MVVTRLEPLTAEGKIALLSEYLDVSITDIQKASLERRASEAAKVEADRLAREIAAEQRRLEHRKAAFAEAWQKNNILITVDGKVTKAGAICEDGEVDITGLASVTMDAHSKLLLNFRGEDGLRNVQTGLCLERVLKCTCGKTHQVRVFISSFE